MAESASFKKWQMRQHQRQSGRPDQRTAKINFNKSTGLQLFLLATIFNQMMWRLVGAILGDAPLWVELVVLASAITFLVFMWNPAVYAAQYLYASAPEWMKPTTATPDPDDATTETQRLIRQLLQQMRETRDFATITSDVDSNTSNV